MSASNNQIFKQAENELTAAGWTKVMSVMHDGGGIRYGSLYVKDGVKFYLNKDTVSPHYAADKMAEFCQSLFN